MSDEPKIVSLSRARPRFLERRSCDHLQIEVDEDLSEVKCLDCNQMLNPMGVLARAAQREINLGRMEKTYREQAKLYKQALAELKLRNRVKCRHCGKITPINRKVPS